MMLDEGGVALNNMLATSGSNPGLACRRTHPQASTKQSPSFDADLEHYNKYIFLSENIWAHMFQL